MKVICVECGLIYDLFEDEHKHSTFKLFPMEDNK